MPPKRLGPAPLPSRSAAAKPTHPSLDARFIRIGTLMRHAPVGQTVHTLAPGPGYRTDRVEGLLSDSSTAPAVNNNKRFGQAWRGIQEGQDELVSTSSVRSLMRGVRAGGGLGPAKLTELTQTFEQLSRVRFPTRWTGYATTGTTTTDTMQHPTSPGQGLFADPKGKALSRHQFLDLGRRAAVADAMEAEAAGPAHSAESIAVAGLRRAVEFDLNEFAAPATASGVVPLSRPGRTPAQLRAESENQTSSREDLKAIHVRLGGVQQFSTDHSMDRGWAPRPGARESSPPRTLTRTPSGAGAPAAGPAAAASSPQTTPRSSGRRTTRSPAHVPPAKRPRLGPP